jgi:hypothetical protein
VVHQTIPSDIPKRMIGGHGEHRLAEREIDVQYRGPELA